jgi:serine/threonine protein kinase
MEWVPGLRMNLWLKYARPGRSKNKDRLLRLGRQVTDVVSYLHRKGIIHGDLTPGNLLVHRNRIRLVDMESARKVGAHRIGRMRLSAKPSPLSAELKKVGEVLKTLTGADHPK